MGLDTCDVMWALGVSDRRALQSSGLGLEMLSLYMNGRPEREDTPQCALQREPLCGRAS